jgi:hypothetical protein
MRVFGQPQLLGGEDRAAYEQLVVLFRAAVKPANIIDEMYIADVVSLEWEVLRWRRLKASLIRAHGLGALEEFLKEALACTEHFVEDLTKILADNLPEDEAKDAQTLARACAHDEPDADAKVNEVLASINLNMDDLLDDARGRTARELMQRYERREPEGVALVDELLSDAGMSMDGLMADALVAKLDYVERIDHLTAIAERRRNASLQEIDRRRIILGETLRRSVQEIEDGEFKEIEPAQADGKGAA